MPPISPTLPPRRCARTRPSTPSPGPPRRAAATCRSTVCGSFAMSPARPKVLPTPMPSSPSLATPRAGTRSAFPCRGRWRAMAIPSIPTWAIPSSIIHPWPRRAMPRRASRTTMLRASTVAPSRCPPTGATSASSSISTASTPLAWCGSTGATSATRRAPIPTPSSTSPAFSAREKISSPCASIAGATAVISRARTCGTSVASTATSISTPHRGWPSATISCRPTASSAPTPPRGRWSSS